ncbi:hypothetical protein NQ314_006227 [Rhamnusium bicolor]|uniref:DDE Tnp4 domain-containing protein n=1 Tax=Rhamnusium bicolor TaxID=1586634 RepID=A0AAV8Z5V1_9CUCU|nr:hypothetical protein NQ314_006227 [Rhamnusium bicolor]
MVSHSDLAFLTLTLAVYEMKKTKEEKTKALIKKWYKLRGRFTHERLLNYLRVTEPEDYKNFLQMNEAAFDNLLELIRPKIVKQDTVMRKAIPASQRLSITLRYLASGMDLEDLKFTCAIAPQTLEQIIMETCKSIIEALKENMQWEPANYLRSESGRAYIIIWFKKCVSRTQRNYHRMFVEEFDCLLKKVSPLISKVYHAREPILPGEMLSATLSNRSKLSYNYRLGLSTVSNIIKHTCSAIWEALNEDYLSVPTEDIWKNIANDFGAIDGKHIRIQAPPHTGSDYFNYKDFFSIVLLAVYDADYCFTVVDIGAKDRQSDRGIFSKLSEKSDPIHYCLVADSAFPFEVNLMRPYPGNFLPQNERVFNYRLSRARRVIENTFGTIVTKWRILERPIIAKLETIEKMICALVCTTS